MSNSSAWVWLVCTCMLATQLPAQSSSASPSLQTELTANQLVEHLVENAATYRATLPSIAAHETILSKASVFPAFRDNTVHAEATMRVKRGSDGQLEESRQFTAINGKPPDAAKPVTLPLTFSGAFSDFPTQFFAPEHVPCFNFVLAPHLKADAPLTLSISPSPQAGALPQCSSNQAGLAALARIDPATHQLIHLERTYPDDPAIPARMLFLSIDLAPTPLGQSTFWLPSTVTAHAKNGKIRLDWLCHYSDYHRFAATSTILPAP